MPEKFDTTLFGEKPRLTVERGEINGKEWIEQINNAFVAGDYELIVTLQKVKPEAVPDKNLVENKMRDLIINRPGNLAWAAEYKEIKSISRLNLEPAIVGEEFKKLLDKFGQEEKIFDQLKAFREATGYAPNKEIVLEKYRGIIKGDKLGKFKDEDLFEDISRFAGINPDESVFLEMLESRGADYTGKIASIFNFNITDGIIQQTYENVFDKKGYLDEYLISQIGGKPNEMLMQRLYEKIISSGKGANWIKAVESLKKATGVAPIYAQEKIDPIINDLFDRGDYYDLETVIKTTGFGPRPEIIENKIRGIINGAFDNNQNIKNDLKRLKKIAGTNFQMPESAINEYYKKAATEMKPRIIIEIYEALGVKPDLDEETIHNLLVSQIDEPTNNPVGELINNVFGIGELKISEDEIDAKMEKDLNELQFDRVAMAMNITGRSPDVGRLNEAIDQYAENEFNVSRLAGLKNLLQKFGKNGVSVSLDKIESFYARSIEESPVNLAKIKELNEIFVKRLPFDLAQIACKRFADAGDISGIESVCKLSGRFKPDLSVEEIYNLNLLQVENGQPENIKRLEKISGVVLEFKPEDIQDLYKKMIFNGNAGRIAGTQKITGIKPIIDKETAQFASKKIQDCVSSFEKSEYGQRAVMNMVSDRDFTERELDEIPLLVKTTGVTIEENQLQSACQQILANDRDWKFKLNAITEKLNIWPKLPQDIVDRKGSELVSSGNIGDLATLLKFGKINFVPQDVETAYQKILDDKEGSSDCLEEMIRLFGLTGIQPAENVVGEIHLSLIKDKRFARKEQDRTGAILELIKNKLEINLSDSIVQNIFEKLFYAKEFEAAKELRDNTKIRPDFLRGSIKETCDTFLEAEDFDSLKRLQRAADIPVLPFSNDSLQKEYQKLAQNSNFGGRNDNGLENFYLLFELSEIPPVLSPEVLSNAYHNVMDSSINGDYDRFYRAVGIPPTQGDLQNRIYEWLADRVIIREDDVANFLSTNEITISEKTVQEAVVSHLENATLINAGDFIKKFETIKKIFGEDIRIDPVIAQQNIQRMIRDDKQHNASDKIDDIFLWFEKNTGQKPSSSMVNLAYSQTLGRIISYDEKLKKNGEFLEVWDWLKEKYETPSADAVQKIYLSNLFSLEPGQAENINYIFQFTGVKPDINKIIESGGISIREADIEKQLQSLSQNELINGHIERVTLLEEIFGRKFFVPEGDLQILYAKVILENNAHAESILKFLLEKTGIAPSGEIVKAEYRDLFSRKFKPKDLKSFQDQFGIDFGEKDIIDEQFNALIAQGDWEHAISAIEDIPGCRKAFEESIKRQSEICRDKRKSTVEREKSIGILIELEQKMAEVDFGNGSDDDNEFQMPHFDDREKLKKELYSLITDGIDGRLVDDKTNFELDEFQQMALEKIEKLVETGAGTIVADFGKRGLFEIMANKSSVSKISFMVKTLREGKYDPNLKSLDKLIDLENLVSGRIAGGGEWENEIKLALSTVDRGFSIREIKRFPFLVSPLAEKK